MSGRLMFIKMLRIYSCNLFQKVLLFSLNLGGILLIYWFICV